MQRIGVSGIVQGVGFRPFVYRLAVQEEMRGYVRNLGDAGVEIVLDCDEKEAQEFVKLMLARLPPLARIYGIKIESIQASGQWPVTSDQHVTGADRSPLTTGHLSSFRILESADSKEGSGSIIPPDVGMCDACLSEMRDPKNRRHNYFFTTCTDCGPRFTIIDKLPYDRPNTTMRDFPMDRECAAEYRNPSDRRYHAQTIACRECGPKAWVADKDGNPIGESRAGNREPEIENRELGINSRNSEFANCKLGRNERALDSGFRIPNSEDAIWQVSCLLSEGAIVAIKGNGGFHIATATSFDGPVALLRQRRRRRQQPFALMARDIGAAKSFAEVSVEEEKLLTSAARPIVLLRKSANYNLAESIAPGLHNIGIMLPYTGMHHMLFDKTNERAFVMTSANLPGDPMVMSNEEAVRKLSGIVDYFLFHDRKIAQRCDDSVIRFVAGEQAFIRRSRGWAPAPVEIDMRESKIGNRQLGRTLRIPESESQKSNITVLALGAELCVTSCILDGKRAFLSQHIGDMEKPDTLAFLEDATRQLMHLTNTKPEAITCDLHPQFTTTRLARRMAEEFSIPLKRVQHHWAHAASLLAEHGINETVAIIADGVGYGADGHAWGGEILYATAEKFERLGHLQEQPMAGGDLAAKHPLRMAAGMLDKSSADELLAQNASRLPHGPAEAGVILKQLESGKAPTTTSCGRVMDAASAILGLCYERTYEGEPAMRLESAAIGGKSVLHIEPEINRNILETSNFIQAIYENRKKFPKRDLAYSVHTYVAKGLAGIAAHEAGKKGIRAVGFSGGCAYNEILVSEIKKALAAEGLALITNTKVPRGDGGVSLGQALIGRFL